MDKKNIIIEEKEYWLSLSKKQQKIKLERIYTILRKVAGKQLLILDEFKKSKITIKTERHLYFFVIVKSFWEDADFALALGKNKYSFYATYPARTVMGKLLKILWFSKRNEKEQDLIMKKELLKRCLFLYRRELADGRATNEFENYYNKINDVGFSAISEVKSSELDAFPKYEELCKKSGLVDADVLYNSYRDLSGLPHGDLLSVFLSQGEQKSHEYVRAVYNIVRFSIEMLKITDFHIENKTKNDIEKAIKLGNNIRLGIKTSK